MRYMKQILSAVTAAAMLGVMLSGCAASDSIREGIDNEAEKQATEIMRNAVSLDTDAQAVYNAFRQAASELQLAHSDADFSVMQGSFVYSPSDLSNAQASPDDLLSDLLFRVNQQRKNLGGKLSSFAVRLDADGFIQAAAVTDGVNFGTYPTASDGSTFSDINAALAAAG